MNRLNKDYGPSDKFEQNTNLLNLNLSSRREFLKRAVVISAAVLIGNGLVTACGNSKTGERSEARTGQIDQTSLGAAASGTCAESADLSTGDVAARQAVSYVDKSSHADKFCANCRFFKQPAGDAVCGGCEIVKGPIAPEGYCNVWVAQS